MISGNKIVFSIVIPTYNRNDTLSICLEKLSNLQFESDPISYEIIITDDSPGCEAQELLSPERINLKWVKGPEKGPAANRNNGVCFANGEWIIFLDDDCIPDKYLLQAYYSAIIVKSQGCNVFEGKIVADRDQNRFDEEAPLNLFGDRLWSCNFCIKKTSFIDIGQFDERFPFASMEDIDLHERIKKVAKITFVDNAIVLHPWRRIRIGSNFKKRIFSFRLFVYKHYTNQMTEYRWSRVKIFFSSLVSDFKNLVSYHFKGTLYYFELCIFNFLTIFI